jgi:hypothetical protein
MADTTITTDLDTLEAEITALAAADAEQSARINALLARTGGTAARLADCQLMAEQAERELAVQERYQRWIARAIEAG